jgi:hypothetical protein
MSRVKVSSTRAGAVLLRLDDNFLPLAPRSKIETKELGRRGSTELRLKGRYQTRTKGSTRNERYNDEGED